MQVAESYLNQDAFYFPHNLDFRGRAYPMHPNLNHLGADLSRGLLQFADAKPLGPDGLRWLEISVSLHHTLVHSQKPNSLEKRAFISLTKKSGQLTYFTTLSSKG